jgi:hypothetical protein
MRTRLAALAVVALTTTAAVPADEPVDLTTVTRIRSEGLLNSKVMDTLGYLSDVIGPRLTGSPQMKRANEWTRQQLEGWGLANAHLESWGPFGRGWTFDHVSVHMVQPEPVPLLAYPRAWTPGTAGVVRGELVRAKVDSEADLDKLKGKLSGKILLLGEARELKPPDKPVFNRYTTEGLDELAKFQTGLGRPPFDREAIARRARLQRALRDFLPAEGALATIEASDREAGVVTVGGGGSYRAGENPGVPALVMAAEHFNRLSRLLERKMPVELELDVRARFIDQDPMAYNTVAEIPGTDRKGEVVMLGAHMDSWHTGTGATDNGAGVAITMEAVRILRALDLHPRRTIRIALWSGEEQGLLGSRAYVREHFASRPEQPGDAELPTFLRPVRGPLTLKPEHAKLSAYFNVDNGTGKIRGIYTQQNAAVVPLFEAWLRPFADLGATTVTMRNTGGTDHQSFDAVGLPGFQFIQDEADYNTRTHHTNMDLLDRAQKDDLMQAAVVLASFVYDTAMRDELLPRKPLPRESPSPSPATSPAPGPASSPHP